ncbi:MAG: hypothetical protein L6R40_007200 [Gallowayella cf. fulva]|nr:MAG: hypothetical protein L6R40_007200 [Xanthomendoza cf. fulva]
MSGTSRHKACNHCREKKIRCDGGQPCQRCRAGGDVCDYSAQTKPTKLDLTQALEAFNDRLFQAESALAAQQNVPTRPFPGLPTAAFDLEHMALWSQPLGIQQATPDRNATPYPGYGPTTTSAMDFQPAGDFANAGFYPALPNTNVPPSNIPVAPASTGSSTASLPQLSDTSTTFPFPKECLGGELDWMKLQSSGTVSRNRTGSNLNSRVTTPGTSDALSEALETLPQHAAYDLYNHRI